MFLSINEVVEKVNLNHEELEAYLPVGKDAQRTQSKVVVNKYFAIFVICFAAFVARSFTTF